MKYFWVPEHPSLPLYRIRVPEKQGKLGELVSYVTSDIHSALQFSTREECEKWIEENPVPVFIAKEHGVDFLSATSSDGHRI